MPYRTTPRRHAAPLPALAAGAVAVLLAGCSGGPDPAATVTVTTAPTTPAASTASTPESTGPTSEVADRGHDVGTLAGVEEIDGTTVLTLDRWTYADWSEERVSQEGVPLEPLTENPFRNQNSDSTYAVPVSSEVVVGLNSCTVGSDQQPRIATAVGSVEDLVPGETMWLLTYTDGVLTRADTAPVC